jgi:hypothetical protein
MLQLAANERSALGRIHTRDASGEPRVSLSCFRSPPFNVPNFLPRRISLPSPCICRRQPIGTACGACLPGTEVAEEEADRWGSLIECGREAPLADEGSAVENDFTVESRLDRNSHSEPALGLELVPGTPRSTLEKQFAKGARSLGHPRRPRRATIIPSRRMPSEGERHTPAHVRRRAKDKDVP